MVQGLLLGPLNNLSGKRHVPPAGGQAEALLPMLHITKPLSAVAVSAGVHATPRVNALLAHMVVAELHARWQHPRT